MRCNCKFFSLKILLNLRILRIRIKKTMEMAVNTPNICQSNVLSTLFSTVTLYQRCMILFESELGRASTAFENTLSNKGSSFLTPTRNTLLYSVKPTTLTFCVAKCCISRNILICVPMDASTRPAETSLIDSRWFSVYTTLISG